MSPIVELGNSIRVRRTDMCLTQATLARLSGLSRATVNQVENGTVLDLSLERASRLLSAIGLSVVMTSPRAKAQTKSSALSIAARTASVSYTRSIDAEQIREAMITAIVLQEFKPHVATLLDEAPMSVLAAAVEQVHVENEIERTTVWRNLKAIATSFKSDRGIWT